MNKLFVPYELALLAKEKGFDSEIYFGWFSISGSFSYHNAGMEKPFYKEDTKAPIYQQLVDWFETKDLYIKVTPHNIHFGIWWDWEIESSDIEKEKNSEDEESYSNKYLAYQAAFLEVFKLI